MVNTIKNKIKNNIEKQIYIPLLILSILHFLLTFATDRWIFIQPISTIFLVHYCGIKLMHLVFLLGLYQLLYRCGREIQRKNEKVLCFLKYFGIYFGVMMVFLALLWPGVWRWDEFLILDAAANLRIHFWQHWLTGEFYNLALGIFPFPGGILILQCLVISLIVATIMYRLHQGFPSKWVYLFYLPLLLPTTITNNLYPMRIILFGYLELLLFALIILKYVEKSKITKKEWMGWGVLLALVASWRTEAQFYILVIPLALIFIFWKKFLWKQFLMFVCIAGILTGGIGAFQSLSKSSNTYMITGIMEPLSGILSTDFKSNSKQEDLEVIDKVISVELLQTTDGDTAFHHGARADRTPEDEKALQKTYYKLVFYNIPAFWDNRVALFLQNNGMIANINTNVGFSPIMYDFEGQNLENEYWGQSYKFATKYRWNQPLDVGIRRNLLSILECRDPKNYLKTNRLFGVFYNALPAMVLLALLMGYWMIRKNRLFLLPLLSLTKTFLVFVTAPANMFMYYFPTFLVGYGVFMLAVLVARGTSQRRMLPKA